MENYKKSIVELASNLVFEYKPFPSTLPPYPTKTEILKKHPPIMRFAAPESVGISSLQIAELLYSLEREPNANVHSIVIAHSGKIIAEASACGYDARVPHLSHSMSKSIVGIMIMMLLDEGKLDTGMPIIDFFENFSPMDRRMADVTVENLLTMTSGVGFGEAGVVSETEWTRSYLTSEMSFAPGERFAYNSMNSYILARIADKICNDSFGISAEDYINGKLLSPLGIGKPLWEKSPEGIIKGGFGMYMSCEAWAAVGCAILDSALHKKSTLIPSERIWEGIRKRKKTFDAIGGFDYGYHFWVGKDEGSILLNGMFGQNVLLDLNSGLVIAVTSGNNELFSKSATISTVTSHVKSLSFHTPSPETAPAPDISSSQSTRDNSSLLQKNATRGGTFSAKRELRRATRGFFRNRGWITVNSSPSPFNLLSRFSSMHGISDFYPIVGEYIFPKNNQGLLPVFMRTMQNNFSGGIRSFELSLSHGLVYLTSNELASRIQIKFGLYSHIKNEIDVLGEKYSVMALAGREHQPSGEIIYKFELLFPEFPNSRDITLSLTPLGRLSVKMHEMPDEKIADSFVDAIPTLSGRVGMLYRLLEQRLGKKFIEEKLAELFSPEFTAFSTDLPDWEAALREENERIDGIIASSRLVRSLVFNFLGNEEKIKEDSGGALGKIAGIIGKLF